MASERLTVSEKDRIAKSIINPIIEQSRKESEKFGKFADEYFKKILPTKCALENINTTKQLKDNFPEAYAIFMKIPKEDVKGNKCDDIEKLRAELSKL